MDFFSWHSYEDVGDTLLMDEAIHLMLTETAVDSACFTLAENEVALLSFHPFS